MAVDCCAEIGEGLVPQPAGTKLCDWQTAQVGNATADQGVLYRSDFVGDSTEIAPQASERIRRLVDTGSANSLPWLIEPSGNAALDRDRVHAVSTRLSQFGGSALNVTVAIPAALGLSGPDAERAAASVGQGRGSSASTGGGFGGQSFGRGF